MTWGEFINTFMQLAFGVLSAAVVAAMPFVIPIVRERLIKATDKDTADKLIAAADAAAGAGYKYAATHKGGFRDPVVSQTATQIGVDYLNKNMPDALKYFEKSQHDVKEMVDTRIGQLMAADPTISAAIGSAASPDTRPPYPQAPSGDPPTSLIAPITPR